MKPNIINTVLLDSADADGGSTTCLRARLRPQGTRKILPPFPVPCYRTESGETTPMSADLKASAPSP
jgi:hypothetical protein